MTIGRVSVLRATILALVFAMTAFQVYVVLFGAPQPFVFCGTDLGFALVLVFLLFPAFSNMSRSAQVLGLLFIAASLAMIGYLIYDQKTLYMRVQFVDPPSRSQFWLAVTLNFLVLEACRRTLGPALPPTAVAFIHSAFGTGKLTPGFTADVMYLTTERIFGIPLNVSATYLVLFGAMAERLGTGRFFIEFGSAIAGRTTGGPAKVTRLS